MIELIGACAMIAGIMFGVLVGGKVGVIMFAVCLVIAIGAEIAGRIYASKT